MRMIKMPSKVCTVFKVIFGPPHLWADADVIHGSPLSSSLTFPICRKHRFVSRCESQYKTLHLQCLAFFLRNLDMIYRGCRLSHRKWNNMRPVYFQCVIVQIKMSFSVLFPRFGSIFIFVSLYSCLPTTSTYTVHQIG